MEFAISTTAFRGKPPEVAIEFARKRGYWLEFSSGMPHHPDMEAIFLSAQCNRLPHNYFPAPKEPFVLNLASLDPRTWETSVEHAKQGLRLAAQSGAPFYSLHAGFCLDPSPKSLGKKFGLEMQHPREDHWRRFLSAIDLLSEEASRRKVQILIENNVLAPFNVQPDGGNPLLCCDPQEILKLFSDRPGEHLALLLDTGHLLVSARTLGFDVDQAVRAIAPHVRALHHSDNNGAEDTNEPLSDRYWFLRHMYLFKNALHVLEVHDQTPEGIDRQYELLKGA